MHEILTLQLGHRANHVATHFWNIQESYFTYDATAAPSPVNHDIHFRPGIGANGEDTFTPRTLIYDLKGGFGGLRKWGGLYDQQLSLDNGEAETTAEGVWDGKVVLQQDPRIQQSEYQRSLDEGDPNPQTLNTEAVRYWSDFNRVFYHPRSIVQIKDYELGSSLVPFEKWDSGEELFQNIDRDEDLLDRDLRPWAEECDQMQGIQVITGADDAWGGFTARYTERLRDEFGKMGLWVWGIEEQQGRGQRAKQLLRTVNAAKTMNEMAMHSSMYVPLSVPAAPLPKYLHLDRDSEWNTSALLSAVLETMTLPSRLRPDGQNRGFLGDLEAALNVNGNQRIAQLQCTFLDPETKIPSNTDTRGPNDHRTANTGYILVEEDETQNTNSELDIDLSCSDVRVRSSTRQRRLSTTHTFGAVECIRGRSKEAKGEEMDEDDVAYSRKRRRFAGLSVTERYFTPLQYPILDSFPHIFSNRSNLYNTIAVHTSLSTTTAISNRIKALRKVVDRMVAYEERENLCNGLGEIGEAYEEGWDPGSGEDSDD